MAGKTAGNQIVPAVFHFLMHISLKNIYQIFQSPDGNIRMGIVSVAAEPYDPKSPCCGCPYTGLCILHDHCPFRGDPQ